VHMLYNSRSTRLRSWESHSIEGVAFVIEHVHGVYRSTEDKGWCLKMDSETCSSDHIVIIVYQQER
jgi:hypothetical protein